MIKRSLLLSLLLATGLVFIIAVGSRQGRSSARHRQRQNRLQNRFAAPVTALTVVRDSQIPTNPKLAASKRFSTHAEYINKQLTNFKSQDGKPAGERANPIMGGMAATLSEADMKGLAASRANSSSPNPCQEQSHHRTRPETLARR